MEAFLWEMKDFKKFGGSDGPNRHEGFQNVWSSRVQHKDLKEGASSLNMKIWEGLGVQGRRSKWRPYLLGVNGVRMNDFC